MQEETTRKYLLHGIWFALLAALSFSTQDALVKWLSSDFSLLQLLFIRSLIGVSTLFVIIKIRFGWSGFSTRHPYSHTIRALCNLLAFLSFYFAITRMPLADATSLALGYILFMVLLSGIFLNERPSVQQTLALIAGLSGVLIVIQPTNQNVDWLGAGAAVFGSFMFAALGLQTRFLSRTESTELMVFTGALFFLVVTGLSLPFVWEAISTIDLIPLIGLGAIGILGQYTVAHAFGCAPVYIVGPIEYTGLLWAILFGWWFFDDFPSLIVLGGSALIVTSCVAIVILEKGKESRSKLSTRH